MKKIYYLMVVTVMIIAACQTKTTVVPVDLVAAKDTVTNLLDQWNTAMKAKDINAMTALLTDDGLLCGTDPSEFWDKKTYVDEWTKLAADTSFVVDYSVDKREIRIAADGNSALAIEQMYFKAMSEKMPFRLIYHLVKNGKGWQFDFIGWNFIPKNEDIPKLNKALE
jgi:ketosteroid isomerase-like protein